MGSGALDAPMHRGVYRRSARFARFLEGDGFSRACLRFNAVASHRSAGALQTHRRLPSSGSVDLERLVLHGDWRRPNRRRRASPVRRNSIDSRRSIAWRSTAFPCTGLARTVLDVAAVAPTEQPTWTRRSTRWCRGRERVTASGSVATCSIRPLPCRGATGCGRLRAGTRGSPRGARRVSRLSRLEPARQRISWSSTTVSGNPSSSTAWSIGAGWQLHRPGRPRVSASTGWPSSSTASAWHLNRAAFVRDRQEAQPAHGRRMDRAGASPGPTSPITPSTSCAQPSAEPLAAGGS